jgi:hypothetical protein
MHPLRKIIWITGMMIPLLIFGRWVKNEVSEQTMAYVFFGFLVVVSLSIIYLLARTVVRRIKKGA